MKFLVAMGGTKMAAIRQCGMAAWFLSAAMIWFALALPALAADTAAMKDSIPSRFTLENGLEIVVIPDRRAPVVTHMVWYKAGAADEPWGKSGIAHFLEHLLFKGTVNTPPGEFSRKVAEIGGRENAFTTVDSTAYYQKVPPGALAMVMRYEADRMVNLVLDEADIIAEREVILQERRQRVDARPGGILAEAMGAAVYRNHPYGIPIIGWEHEMASLTLEDAMAFYRKFYRPDNAVLVVAGDVAPATVLELAQGTYGEIEAAGAMPQRQWPVEPVQRAERVVSHADKRVSTPSMRRIYTAPSYRVAAPGEAEALDLLAAILGGSSTSRIKRQLLVDNSVAASAGASYWGGFYDIAEFSLYVTPLPDVSIEDAEARLDGIVADLLANGVSEAELETAKEALIKSTLFSRDSQTSMARLYGTILSTGGDIDDVLEWPDRIRAVTTQDVMNAARKYLRKSRSVTGYLKPEVTL